MQHVGVRMFVRGEIKPFGEPMCSCDFLVPIGCVVCGRGVGHCTVAAEGSGVLSAQDEAKTAVPLLCIPQQLAQGC